MIGTVPHPFSPLNEEGTYYLARNEVAGTIEITDPNGHLACSWREPRRDLSAVDACLLAERVLAVLALNQG